MAVPVPRCVLASWSGDYVCHFGPSDVALWDIKGKALKTPVYNLLGGKSREGVLVYTHANGADIEEAIASVQQHMDEGYLAVRAQSGVPGVASSYGVPKAGKSYEPAERGLPGESLWSTERYLNHAPKLFERLRTTVGEDVHLLHDVHHRLTPIEAARLGKALEPYHLFWMEDPTPAENQEAFKLIRQHTTTPIATGEVFNSFWDAHDLIRNGWIDYIRMTIVHGGGITALKKAADFAAVYQVRTGFHGASDLSPVTMAAALHFGLAIHNFGIQEHMHHTALTDEVFPHAYSFTAGYMHPGDAPGLGVDIDEALGGKTPVSARVSAHCTQAGWHTDRLVNEPTGSFSTAVPCGSFNWNWSSSSCVFTVSLVMVSLSRNWSSGRLIVITDGKSWSPNFW